MQWNEIETRLGLWVSGQLTLMARWACDRDAYTVLACPVRCCSA